MYKRQQDIITQETEETVAIKPKAEPKKKEEVKKPEKTEAEKAEEARKLAAAKAERERKEAEEAARKRVAGAFGKGAQMGSKGDTEGEGIQGSPTGNAPSGATSGTGGYGSFNLGGRSLGEGGLPRPVYNVQDEGRVVVTITVNPAGHVIATSINRQTNTVNPALRKAAAIRNCCKITGCMNACGMHSNLWKITERKVTPDEKKKRISGHGPAD